MSDVEEQSLSQGGESDQSSQETDQAIAFEMDHADAFELNPRPWYVFEAHLDYHVQRRLKQRHVQMIAIAGTIGTGLFLGSGRTLGGAGPLGALIAYFHVGTVAYASFCSLCEMTTWAPVLGTFPYFAERWVDPALGFAVGWNYFYGTAISTPVEINAAVILLTFWDKNVLCVFACLVNIVGVRWFGESEFAFSMIKILLLIGLLISGLIIDLRKGPEGHRIGFGYWNDPGAVARAGLVENLHTDRFIAILSVLVQAAFSFQGMELVAIAAAETESPRRNITKAMRRVLFRIITFYILGIIMVGMLVAYNDPALLQNSGTAAQSPFVIAINRAGVRVLPHIINAAIFSSAFSAGNSFVYSASRILHGLAVRGQAPRIFACCTKDGLPIYAVIVASSFSLLSFLNIYSGPERVFNWFVYLSATAGFSGWFSMNLTYIFFYRGMKEQEFDVVQNAYHNPWQPNPWQPYLAYWGCAWSAIFVLINGLTVFFGKFNVSGFFAAYINIPIFFILYFGFKYTMGTNIVHPRDGDFVTDIPTPDETEIPEDPPRNVWEHIAEFVF
ncbi:APC amino acid permease [Laccaria bicolor S238N-H82]|uniref:APC amino acid permease n=1 Tax=Laccaria bicolor (strain S238N-H82 / ATCC MYA-4686) TaxID=486041 RepID=B0CWR2_LACBS|nr:APC amino acid permease [Laccaria bicolor S238N-H82]EDR13114.1 APC amino acid permease [Laccaria bicolor S238N-H82]|eukprot:XP_001875612.1 APC amino acid permease [Laccaria bicolor S238N-H82]